MEKADVIYYIKVCGGIFVVGLGIFIPSILSYRVSRKVCDIIYGKPEIVENPELIEGSGVPDDNMELGALNSSIELSENINIKQELILEKLRGLELEVIELNKRKEISVDELMDLASDNLQHFFYEFMLSLFFVIFLIYGIIFLIYKI